jgi:hypothetical protein
MSKFPMKVPVIERMELRRNNVYEHTPLDYYKYGEYPRFTRPVDAQQPRTVTVWNERELAAAIRARGTK